MVYEVARSKYSVKVPWYEYALQGPGAAQSEALPCGTPVSTVRWYLLLAAGNFKAIHIRTAIRGILGLSCTLEIMDIHRRTRISGRIIIRVEVPLPSHFGGAI